MKTCPCCQIATRNRGDAHRPASRWRRTGEFAGWIIPGATIVLLPKCPVCVAMYVALFSGVGISISSASKLRTSLLILCVTVLLGLALKRVCQMASGNKRRRATTNERGSNFLKETNHESISGPKWDL